MVSLLIIATVGDHTDSPYGEATLHTFHHGDERLDIGGITRPHLATDWLSIPVEDQPHHHLTLVRPVVLALAVSTKGFTSLTLEVDGGCVEENQVE